MTAADTGNGECHEISLLIPWYVNGTLDPDGCHRVQVHVACCAGCRGEVAQDQRLRRLMNIESTVEIMPAASLKRMLARLGDDARALPARTADYRPIERRKLLAATVAAVATGLCVIALDQWGQVHSHGVEPRYFTVTAARPSTPGAVIRAVFAPTATLGDVQAILDAAGLQIVAGPTEAGVYSLSSNSRLTVPASLRTLRGNAKVRFAESIQSDAEQGAVQ